LPQGGKQAVPTPLDWDKLRIFHAAAEAGSFTHAALTLHLSQSSRVKFFIAPRMMC